MTKCLSNRRDTASHAMAALPVYYSGVCEIIFPAQKPSRTWNLPSLWNADLEDGISSHYKRLSREGQDNAIHRRFDGFQFLLKQCEDPRDNLSFLHLIAHLDFRHEPSSVGGCHPRPVSEDNESIFHVKWLINHLQILHYVFAPLRC